MLIPCEVASKSLVPALRALLAKELMQTYGLKQTEVASLLGITQTAVSKYAKHARGRVPEIEGVAEVRSKISEIAELLTDERVPRYQIARHICTVCRIARRKKLMCELCRRYNPLVDAMQCDLCVSLRCYFQLKGPRIKK